MNWKKDFLWPFSGLKIGFHETQILLHQVFFNELERFEIISGEGKIYAKLDKKETMMLLSLSLDAQLNSGCDRCCEPLSFSATGTMELVYKFGDEPSFDESLVVLPKDTFQLDLLQPCFELMVISLPSRYLHPEEDCNQEIIKHLQKTENENTDPRWDILKKNS